jgi:hypothetical protein
MVFSSRRHSREWLKNHQWKPSLIAACVTPSDRCSFVVPKALVNGDTRAVAEVVDVAVIGDYPSLVLAVDC